MLQSILGETAAASVEVVKAVARLSTITVADVTKRLKDARSRGSNKGKDVEEISTSGLGSLTSLTTNCSCETCKQYLSATDIEQEQTSSVLAERSDAEASSSSQLDDASFWLDDMPPQTRTSATAEILPEVNWDKALVYDGNVLYQQKHDWKVAVLSKELAEKHTPDSIEVRINPRRRGTAAHSIVVREMQL